MSIRIKILLTMLAIIVIGGGVSFGLASFFPSMDTPTNPLPTNTPPVEFTDETSFPSQSYHLDEGYIIQVAEGWNIVSHTPDRHVDRYRFEQKGNPKNIFTVSFYERAKTPTFDDVIEARYGGGLLSKTEDFTLNDLPVKRITAEFLDMGDTADVLVQVDAKTILSLYGVQEAATNGDNTISKQINFMQRSLRVGK